MRGTRKLLLNIHKSSVNVITSYSIHYTKLYDYEDFDGSFIDLTQDHPIYLSPVEVNLEGNIINTNVQVTEFELSKEQIDGLLSVGRIIFMSTFEDFILDQTTQQKLQKYSVKISSGARVLLRADSKEV